MNTSKRTLGIAGLAMLMAIGNAQAEVNWDGMDVAGARQQTSSTAGRCGAALEEYATREAQGVSPAAPGAK